MSDSLLITPYLLFITLPARLPFPLSALSNYLYSISYSQYLLFFPPNSLFHTLPLSHCNHLSIQLPPFPGILNTLLGVPAECMHQSGVWPCKLSFSCWLQGGKHAKGCGSNKWLFSCCIGDPLHQHQHQSPLENLVDYGKLKMGLSSLPKRIMLRRRDDNELLSVKVSAATIEQLH